MTKASVVRASELIKNFDDVRALNELTLDIEPGIFGLIGPNGSGKTTFLRILLGLIRPNAGTAEVLGMQVDKESLQIREKLGVLHERPTYPTRLTPLRFLHRVRDIYGTDKDPEDLLELVGLSSASHRRIGDLSAGMTQRLGIAQALIGQPELVLLDEPTSNLDVVGRDEIAQLIMELHANLGVSFIVASHVLSELDRICDSVAFIRDGSVLEQGRTLDLIAQYTTNRYRVKTDNPQQLAPILEKTAQFNNVRIVGRIAVTLSSNLETTADLEQVVRSAISHSEIKIYDVIRANSLEDIYMEVMTNAT
ncbi:MAG: ABC transporter ATP-binding protein [Candidatus Thorarchaeota archaeon]|nr:ABC transporter ATP-binding protein [Candidatus Thorarchaeota archaeon]